MEHEQELRNALLWNWWYKQPAYIMLVRFPGEEYSAQGKDALLPPAPDQPVRLYLSLVQALAASSRSRAKNNSSA